MDILENIKKAIAEILDMEEEDITPETYLVRDLGAESIDLLELGVALNSIFKIKINDDEIFLGSLRLYIEEAQDGGLNEGDYLAGKYPFLPIERIIEILNDLEAGPVLKIKDLAGYISYYAE